MPDRDGIAPFLTSCRRDVDRRIAAFHAEQRGVPARLRAASRYALSGGGKCLRPALAIAACEAVGGRRADVLPAACALELVHTYSLVHDDLPCMDDDDLRRGRPTVHRAFDEALAVLTGDALLTDAFALAAGGLARRFGEGDPRIARAIMEIASAAGSAGMAGGQTLDVTNDGAVRGRAWMERMFALKTGRLLRAAVRLGGICAGADAATMRLLTRYGEAAGLAFQIADDLIELRAGKRERYNYAALVGEARATRRAAALVAGADRCARRMKRGGTLSGIARFVAARTY